MSPSADAIDHLIVGAGVTGLAYAWRRVQEGRRVVVLEASDRVGGALVTRRAAGYVWDPGDEAVLGEAPHLEALLATLPAPPRLVEGVGLAGLRRLTEAGLRPLPRPEVPRATRARGLEMPVTLDGLVRLTLGDRVLAQVVQPAAGALYGTPPDRLGGLETAPALAVAAARGRGRPAAHRLRVRVLEAGVASLTEALEAALGSRLRLDAEVLRLTVGPRGLPVVESTAGALAAREVVLAVPASVQASLVEASAPHHAERLAAMPRAPVVSAALGLPQAALAALPPCPGFLVAARRARVRAVLLTSRIAASRAPAGRALVQVRMGGPRSADLPSLADAVLRGIVEADLALALGTPVRTDLCAVTRLSVPAPPPGQRARLAALSGDLQALGIRLLGAHVLGAGLDRQAAAGAPVPRALPPGVELA